MKSSNIDSKFRRALPVLLIGIGVALIILVAPSGLDAQSPPEFTADQAAAGETAYRTQCAVCHGENLSDGEFGPPLSGSAFRGNWSGVTLDELFNYAADNMPPNNPGSLSSETVAQLVSYILEANGLSATTRDLADDPELLTGVVMFDGPISQQAALRRGPGGGLTPGVELPPYPVPDNPLGALTPVTDELLTNPPAGEWLTWRRANDQMAFSPLDQITKENVGDLRVAWSLALPPGPNEATPLVHDGVMFVHSYNDHVQALNAMTGDELWHYSRRLPEGTNATVKRNIALYDDKVYVGTSDLHVVALDAATGAVVWDRAVGDTEIGWRLTGGPLVAAGKVMQGIVGRGPGGAYVQALEADTGEEAWRFYSIARPDEPGGESWNNVPLEERTGGSVWHSGSYDAELNLVFFGPAPTYDTGPLRDPLGQPGVSNDALYTNATVAINPDTGDIVWYYQHVPNDQWDLDWAFERQIVSLPGTSGEVEKLVLTAGKPGIYDAVEADTGTYVFSFDMGIQNIITSIDPETGAKEIDPELIPGTGRPMVVCPHAGGGRSWIPGSYNPETKTMFVPAIETCMDLNPIPEGERSFLSTGVGVSLRPRPDSDGLYGRVQAINMETRETVWTARQRAAQSTGILSTAGGVVFAGALDRWFTAYDDANGEVLWRARLSDVPNSTPISYMLDGKQYVAMVVGYGGAQVASFPSLTPEIPLPATRSSSIWVFELP